MERLTWYEGTINGERSVGVTPTNNFNKFVYDTEIKIYRLFSGVAYDGYLQDMIDADREEKLQEIYDVLGDTLTTYSN